MTTTLLASFPSPPQGVWYLGPFPVRAYALFIIAGIVAALVIGDRRWVARGGEPGVIYDIALWAVTFGLIGGRLYHVLTDWSTYFGPDGAGFTAALRIWDGGLGIWGAVALGGVGAWIACRRRGIPLPAFGDAIAPGIILAQAIGRLGNYFNQELYGRETTLPWGLEIYERRNASGAVDYLNGVSTGQLLEVVHPTFLYELLWNLVVFAVLLVVDRRFKIGHGRLFALYVAGYCVGRFWIELLRSDFATELAGVRINSFTATFVFIGAVVYIMVAPRGREAPASLRGTQETAAESVVKDLTVGASTTGVVAAATVAAEEDQHAEVDEESVGGVGAVEQDELGEAVDEAAQAHDSAVSGQAEASELAAQAGDDVEADGEGAVEPVVLAGSADDATESEVGGVGAVEGEEAEDVFDAVAGEDAGAGEGAEVDEESVEVDEESVGGVGAVEEDELGEAVDEAAQAHDSAVSGQAEASELAAQAGDDVEADGEGAVEPVVLAGSADDATESEVGGVGAVEGEEAEEVFDAVAGEDAGAGEGAEVDEEPAESDVEGETPVAEGEDAAEALAGAAEAPDDQTPTDHDSSSADDETVSEDVAAPEGEDVAEALVESEVADETGGDGSAVDDEAVGDEVIPGDDESEADAAIDGEHVAAPEGEHVAVPEGEEVAVPEGEEVAAPEGEEVAAPEGEDVAEALAGAAEEADADSVAEGDDSAGDAADEEPDADGDARGAVVPSTEGEDAAEALAGTEAADESDAQEPTADNAPPEPAKIPPSLTVPRAGSEPAGGRVRQWLRRRRNR